MRSRMIPRRAGIVCTCRCPSRCSPPLCRNGEKPLAKASIWASNSLRMAESRAFLLGSLPVARLQSICPSPYRKMPSASTSGRTCETGAVQRPSRIFRCRHTRTLGMAASCCRLCAASEPPIITETELSGPCARQAKISWLICRVRPQSSAWTIKRMEGSFSASLCWRMNQASVLSPSSVSARR